MENIGQTIQNIRLSKAVSQEELAKMIDSTQATISKIENNLTNPDIDILDKIARALGESLFKVFYITKLQSDIIPSQNKLILEKLTPYVEKINMALLMK